jgi:hypothetical protein
MSHMTHMSHMPLCHVNISSVSDASQCKPLPELARHHPGAPHPTPPPPTPTPTRLPPQVAAHAVHHVKVSKQQDGEGRASTVFSQLEEPSARLEEVAAMLGLGTDVAADMMAAAQGWPAQQVQQLLAGCPPAEGTAGEAAVVQAGA